MGNELIGFKRSRHSPDVIHMIKWTDLSPVSASNQKLDSGKARVDIFAKQIVLSLTVLTTIAAISLVALCVPLYRYTEEKTTLCC